MSLELHSSTWNDVRDAVEAELQDEWSWSGLLHVLVQCEIEGMRYPATDQFYAAVHKHLWEHFEYLDSSAMVRDIMERIEERMETTDDYGEIRIDGQGRHTVRMPTEEEIENAMV